MQKTLGGLLLIVLGILFFGSYTMIGMRIPVIPDLARSLPGGPMVLGTLCLLAGVALMRSRPRRVVTEAARLDGDQTAQSSKGSGGGFFSGLKAEEQDDTAVFESMRALCEPGEDVLLRGVIYTLSGRNDEGLTSGTHMYFYVLATSNRLLLGHVSNAMLTFQHGVQATYQIPYSELRNVESFKFMMFPAIRLNPAVAGKTEFLTLKKLTGYWPPHQAQLAEQLATFLRARMG